MADSQTREQALGRAWKAARQTDALASPMLAEVVCAIPACFDLLEIEALPSVEDHSIDHHCRHDMLEVHLRQAIVARPPQQHATHSLRVHPFSPRTRSILFPKLRGLLLCSSCLQGLMRWLRQQMHHPTSARGMRAVLARRTGGTGLEGEPRFDAVWLH